MSCDKYHNSNPITIYKCIRVTHYTPSIYSMLYIKYINSKTIKDVSSFN